jgi:hypothetical protein
VNSTDSGCKIFTPKTHHGEQNDIPDHITHPLRRNLLGKAIHNKRQVTHFILSPVIDRSHNGLQKPIEL